MKERKENEYVTIEEASRITQVPKMRIISLILHGELNGIVVSGDSGFLQKSELRYVR